MFNQSLDGLGVDGHLVTIVSVPKDADLNKLKPHISLNLNPPFDLSDLANAHKQQETDHTLGKIVLNVKQ